MNAWNFGGCNIDLMLLKGEQVLRLWQQFEAVLLVLFSKLMIRRVMFPCCYCCCCCLGSGLV